MPGPLEVALAEDAVVSERGLRLPLRRRESVLQLRGLADKSHAAPAAPCRGLDHDGVADLLGLPGRNDRNAGLGRDPLRLELVATRAQRLRRRADPGQSGGVHRLGEARVLGEEAVARMNRVRSGLLRGPDVLL